MNSYLINIDGNAGHVGIAARIRAQDESEAVALLNETLDTDSPISPEERTLRNEESGIEYLRIYTNGHRATPADIDDIEKISDE